MYQLGVEVKITSVELVDLINQHRANEGNKAVLQHKNLMAKIAKEIDILKNAGISSELNFKLGSYKDKQNQERPCYSLTREGVWTLLMTESAVVRHKTMEYINKLEQKVQNANPMNNLDITAQMIQASTQAIGLIVSQSMANLKQEFDQKIEESDLKTREYITQQEIIHSKELEQTRELIGFKVKNTSAISKLLKMKISNLKGYKISARDDYHYQMAKERLFRKYGVWKFEDLPVEKFNDVFADIDTIEDLEDLSF